MTARQPIRSHNAILHIFLIAGAFALFFQVIKAITTGFWLDEAWIVRPIYSYLHGHGWQRSIGLPGQAFQGIYFDNEVISNGPTILFPALGISLILGRISPPALHLFILSHLVLVYFSLKTLKISKSLETISIFLILITLTPQIYFTQFLGECPGALWLVFGFSMLAVALREKSKENWVWVGGIALGLSLLAKLVFVIAILPVFVLIFFLKLKYPGFILKLLVALSLPITLWHFYQYSHVGSWAAYLEVQYRHFEFLNNPLMGSGSGALKTFEQVKRDVWKFLTGGPGFLCVFIFLISKTKNLKRMETSRDLWFLFCWISAVSGLLWWILISNFKFQADGALIRHSTGFVTAALVPASIYFCSWIYKIDQSKIGKTIVFFSGILLLLIFSILIVQRSASYLTQKKGYGIYSAWTDQKQMAKWIDAFGSPNALFPIVNCDSRLSESMFKSHVVLPQEILSSGLFQIVSCDFNRISDYNSAVVLNAASADLDKNLDWKLLEGSKSAQGLWTRINK